MKRLIYTTVYNPSYTGFERFIICQRGLFLDKTRPKEILQGKRKNVFLPCIAFASVDESLYIQEKVKHQTDKFYLKFLNIQMQYHLEDSSKPVHFTAAQSCLYDTYEECLDIAQQTLKTDYYRGLEDYAYSRIAVPIWFKKSSVENFKIVEKSESFSVHNSRNEENFLKNS